jgi:hypothetical protein
MLEDGSEVREVRGAWGVGPSGGDEAVERPGPQAGAAPDHLGGLDAAAFGRASVAEARAIWAHAAVCPECRSLLTRDDELRRRLALLRIDEPRIDVLDEVIKRITQDE